MEQQASSSSSKVKVEYHDPHQVFPYIQAELEARLPLRSLNWNSPGRPLRSIDTLYLDFESADGERSQQPTEAGSQDGDAVRRRSRSQSLRNRDSDGTGNRKERRHQIPGLRQTPYLKILLLRCDDTDTYKSGTRKEVRDWIKAHTPPSQKSSKGSNQENHDAFEWMVLHVVLPDADRKVTWPHRNSAKILGYLRDDFNSSSKNAVDRIGQVPSIRFAPGEDGKASITDPTFTKQAGDAWESALTNVKQLVLSSFDQRVRQYEDDIKEKRAQRQLPGWNFCTFFVLKEGLSRGFESVGLVEDALSGYDELHAELDGTIRSKHADDGTSQDATIFRNVNPELAAIFKDGVDTAQTKTLSLFDKQVIDPDRKAYRDLILSSDISAFDFKTYVFAREIALLQRIGIAGKSSGAKGGIEPRFLCDVCQRTTSFLASAGILLRDEALAAAADSHSFREVSSTTIGELVSRIVSSWTYIVSIYVLDFVDRNAGSAAGQAGRPSSTQSSQNQAMVVSNSHALLSSRRAALVLTARRALQHLAENVGWRSGWEATVPYIGTVSNADSSSHAAETSTSAKDTNPTIQIRNLKKVMASVNSFRAAYASLTKTALQRHQEAGDVRSARSVRTDLAAFRLSEDNYVECADILEQVLQERLDNAWVNSQAAILLMLAQCYKSLKSHDKYVRTILRLVAQRAGETHLQEMAPLAKFEGTATLLRNSIEASRELDHEVVVDLEKFVESVKFDRQIRHRDGAKGFSLYVYIRSSVFEGIDIDKILVTMSRVDANESYEIELSAGESSRLPPGLTQLSLDSAVVNPGLFNIETLSLALGKIRLVHKFQTPVLDTKTKLQKNKKKKPTMLVDELPQLRVWLPSSSPNLQLDIFENVDLDQPKCLALSILPGDQPLNRVEVQVRAATAGLRLYTAQVRVVEGQCSIGDTSNPGVIRLSQLQGSTIRLVIPFQLDHEVKAVTVRGEIVHDIDEGRQIIGKTKTLAIVLPLGVNVQDVFKDKILFSKFSISSSTGIPLRVLDHQLGGSPGFDTACPMKAQYDFPVFGKQPACITYKIWHANDEKASERSSKLRLKITYQCLDEEIVQCIKQSLASHLDSAQLGRYDYLLGDHVESVISTRFSHSELESIALLREISLPSYDEMRWKSALLALPKDESDTLTALLQNWHQDHQAIELPATNEQVPHRNVDIPVEVPPMQIVHTANLRVLDLVSGPSWRVGDAIPGELWVRLTKRWVGTNNVGDSDVCFTYELDAQPDVWIIGGQRKGVFELSEGSQMKLPVLLLPQRAGYLMLPSLDIRVMSQTEKAEQVQCEVDYRSQGESLFILPAIDHPTAGIVVKAGERRSWLVDTA